jgi:hypothetical protein
LTVAASNGAREAKGVVIESSVVGPMSNQTTGKSRGDFCPVGGDSLVITTIGMEILLSDLCKPLLSVQMTDHIQATGATMSSGQREQGMHALRGRRHAGLVRLMVLRRIARPPS